MWYKLLSEACQKYLRKYLVLILYIQLSDQQMTQLVYPLPITMLYLPFPQTYFFTNKIGKAHNIFNHSSEYILHQNTYLNLIIFFYKNFFRWKLRVSSYLWTNSLGITHPLGDRADGISTHDLLWTIRQAMLWALRRIVVPVYIYTLHFA